MTVHGLTETEQRYLDNLIQQARSDLDRVHEESVLGLKAEHARRGLTRTSLHPSALLQLDRNHLTACQQAKIEAVDKVLSASGKPWTRELADSVLADVSGALHCYETDTLHRLRQENARMGVATETPGLAAHFAIWRGKALHELRVDVDVRMDRSLLSGPVKERDQVSRPAQGEPPIAGLRNTAVVVIPHLVMSNRIVELAMRDAEALFSHCGPASAVDRYHTVLRAYLREACVQNEIWVDANASVVALLKNLELSHPNASRQDGPARVLRAFGSILDAFDCARNNRTLAHPNERLLDDDEAVLFINAARTILQYVDAKFAECRGIQSPQH